MSLYVPFDLVPITTAGSAIDLMDPGDSGHPKEEMARQIEVVSGSGDLVVVMQGSGGAARTLPATEGKIYYGFFKSIIADTTTALDLIVGY